MDRSRLIRAAEEGYAAEKRVKSIKVKPGSVDFGVLICVCILVAFGIVMVFSSGYYSSITKSNTSTYYYLIREILFVAIGSGLMFFFMITDYHIMGGLKAWGIVLAATGLILLTYSPIGVSLNNSARWLPIPGLGTFIPAEFAKLAIVIFCASYLSTKVSRVRTLSGIVPILIVLGAITCIVYMQPSTSTALTILLIGMGILFVAGMKGSYFLVMIVAGGAALAYKLYGEVAGGSYKTGRLVSFLDPFAYADKEGYQVVHGLYALASGGMFGRGIGNGVEKALYLPDPMNDFILATIGEETGMIGIMLMIAVYIILIGRCVSIAMRARDRFGTLLVAGVTVMIGLQVILNIMVVLSIFPPTGISLPFISYGGTSMLVFMSSIGIVLNVSRYAVPADGRQIKQNVVGGERKKKKKTAGRANGTARKGAPRAAEGSSDIGRSLSQMNFMKDKISSTSKEMMYQSDIDDNSGGLDEYNTNIGGSDSGMDDYYGETGDAGQTAYSDQQAPDILNYYYYRDRSDR